MQGNNVGEGYKKGKKLAVQGVAGPPQWTGRREEGEREVGRRAVRRTGPGQKGLWDFTSGARDWSPGQLGVPGPGAPYTGRGVCGSEGSSPLYGQGGVPLGPGQAFQEAHKP